MLPFVQGCGLGKAEFSAHGDEVAQRATKVKPVESAKTGAADRTQMPSNNNVSLMSFAGK
jgi:hypothetical protein